MALHTETRAYRLETQGNGLFVTLTRKSDGATAFFQGDDAALWLRNMEAIERTNADDEARLSRTFDHLCSGYDEIMRVEG